MHESNTKPDAGINYGISQADMYQMYAYAKKYHTSDIWLLYPLNEDVKDIGNKISFVSEQDEDQKVNVRIFLLTWQIIRRAFFSFIGMSRELLHRRLLQKNYEDKWEQ